MPNIAAPQKDCRLGFGTSNLAGRIGHKESLRLLEVAFDAGIRHFDTAPMYGYGAAEGVLGEFLRIHRNDVTVATKFGIEPPKKSAAMDVAKGIAKAVVTVVPSLRSRLAKRAASMVSAGNFDVPYARMSLRRSLDALGVAPIDILLMHEITVEQITPQLLEFLAEAKQIGQIKQYGIASTSEESPRILASGKPFGTVVQMPEPGASAARVTAGGDYLYILHSIFSAELKEFAGAIANDSAFAQHCSESLSFDCSDSKRLGRLFLWNAMQRNPGGLIVFSSLSPDSIRSNAALMCNCEFSPGQSVVLDELRIELKRKVTAS